MARGACRSVVRAWQRSEQGGTVDITQLILDDHHEQRRLFAILEQIDRLRYRGAVRRSGDRLAAFLELHAEAEEEIFYPGAAAGWRWPLSGVQGLRTRPWTRSRTTTRSGTRWPRSRGIRSVPDEWYSAVAGANEANSDHMGEEEREGLTDFRRLASLQRRHRASRFLRRLRGAELRRCPAGRQGSGHLCPRGGGRRFGDPPGIAQHREPAAALTAGTLTRGGQVARGCAGFCCGLCSRRW